MRGWKMILAVGFFPFFTSALSSCDAPHAVASDLSAETFTAADKPVDRASFTASSSGEPRLVRIYFNPYVDSIKTVLNYYVNVEGEYNDGSYLPLDTTDIILHCDRGVLAGNEWIVPRRIDFEKVTFIAEARSHPRLRDTITLWIQKWKDPRDAADYKDPSTEGERR